MRDAISSTGKLGDHERAILGIELQGFFEDLFDWPTHGRSLSEASGTAPTLSHE